MIAAAEMVVLVPVVQLQKECRRDVLHGDFKPLLEDA
jgi:hypothetical protein